MDEIEQAITAVAEMNGRVVRSVLFYSQDALVREVAAKVGMHPEEMDPGMVWDVYEKKFRDALGDITLNSR